MKKAIMDFNVDVLCILCMVGVWSCTVSEQQEVPDRKLQLVWQDDFEGPAGSSVDAEKWTYDIGAGDNGWGNAELQYYTDRPENVSLDGEGNLAITARRESFGGAGFTSARIKTQGLFDQRYGRYEARIKLPYGPGMWPAFWMLGNDIDQVGWPQCGEIDIMEFRGQETQWIHGSVHGPGYSGGNAVTKSYGLDNDRFDKSFHVYAVEWGEDYIDYFVDDYLYQRITPSQVQGEWVFDHSFFLLFNLAVGGTFVGFPTDGTPFPQSMLIDYVRVYR